MDDARIRIISGGINVELPGRLQEFVREKSDPVHGAFSSASEYIRDLIRHDYDAEQDRKWNSLHQELSESMMASSDEFHLLEAKDNITEAKRMKASFHSALGVITILHESMDIPNRLLDDWEEFSDDKR